MFRLPPIPPAELRDDQKPVHEQFSQRKNPTKDKFVWQTSEGALLGPFAGLLRTPDIGRAWGSITDSLRTFPGLSQTAREVAILVVGSKFKAAYEVYAHEAIAVAATDLTQAQADRIKSGQKPDGLEDAVGVAYDVATELVNKPGPLSTEKWEAAQKAFGKEGTLALVHYVGFYSYVSVFLNACDVPLPEGESIKSIQS